MCVRAKHWFAFDVEDVDGFCLNFKDMEISLLSLRLYFFRKNFLFFWFVLDLHAPDYSVI